MNPSNPSMPSNPSGQKWTELITHDSGAFLRAFQQGGISTDDLQAPNPADLLPAGAGVSPSAVTSTFSAFNGGILTTFGDNLDNTITFSRDAAGKILVNGGAVPVVGGTPTVANTTLIQAFGQGGNDNISLNEANGALPAAYLFGGTGNDTLIGGSGGDLLFGQSGNDTLLGKGGNDLLFGGSDNDVLTGGDGDDQMFGESGNDRMVWNPGDDSDLMEGGDGVDTAEVNGGNGAETFTATANGTRVRFDRIDPAPFALDIGTTENLVVNMNGGDDSFSASGNLASLIKLTVDGGAGNDRINGGNGDDLLIGGDGNDFIDGNQGKDTALLGAGDDVFQWDPGDGNDTVDGQDGSDTMAFNGSAVNEKFDLSANGSHVRLTRDIGSIVMDVNGVERIDLAPRGGTDVIAVNDLGGTGVTAVNIDLAATPGSGVGDGAADTTIINGTNNVDVIDVFGAGTSLSVVGLSAQVNVAASEGANDQLVVNGQGGDDTMSAITVQAGLTRLTMDGGGGNDTILGSQGADTLRGGDGDDFVRGNRGDDFAVLGAGDDAFQWNPGDGSDTVEGGDGSDRMLFFGANIAEHIDISANGGRVRFTRDIASVVMDLNDVEQVEFRALGGADNIVVGDLSGTDATRIDLDLRGPNGGPDGQIDAVTVNGTQGGNTIVVAGDPGGVTVVGLPAQVNAFFTDPTDQLTINGQGGDDVIDATGLKADGIALTLNGGLGADFMLGGQGNDLIVGGDGNDTALMGAGDDTFVWNPGDDNDMLEGQAGFDTMLFNGANIAENIDISANGGRVRFSRDVASVTMDLNDVEHIVFNARGDADRIAINNMSGTDVTQVDINLEGAPGSGDGAADVVTVKGTTGDDVVQVVGDASGVSVLGLAARANVSGAEAALDRLVIEANAGNDVVDGTGLTATAIGFTANGGDGDDILIGGAGNDILRGGAGDDILIGNDGDDILDGGPGNDILLGGNGLDTLLNGEVAIQSFVAGAGTDDRMDLRALSGMTFDWLIEHAKMVDGNAVLDLGNGGHVTLIGVDVGALHPDDFLMGG